MSNGTTSLDKLQHRYIDCAIGALIYLAVRTVAPRASEIFKDFRTAGVFVDYWVELAEV